METQNIALQPIEQLNNAKEKPSADETNGSRPRDSSGNFVGPEIISVPDKTTGTIPDVNTYQHKKTLSQGMMDLALLSANANQLRYVLASGSSNPFHYVSITLILISLILQILVGIGLVYIVRFNVKKEEQICKADRCNNLITVGILLITIVNVLTSALGVSEVSPKI